MNDKSRLLHYRYKTIIKDGDLKRNTKTMWSCSLKEKRKDNSKEITKYKSIRELKKEIQVERNYTQRRPEQENPYLNRFDKQQLQAKNKNYELVEIVKMKLYKNGTEKEKITSQCTMNRREFQQFLKKKKPAEFTSSRSLEEIKKIYPKKIDVFMNHLKMKVSAIQEQNQTPNQGGKEYGPMILLRNQRTTMREWAKPKTNKLIKIQTPKIEEKPQHFITEYEVEEVSGWDIQTLEQTVLRNSQALIKRLNYKQ